MAEQFKEDICFFTAKMKLAGFSDDKIEEITKKYTLMLCVISRAQKKHETRHTLLFSILIATSAITSMILMLNTLLHNAIILYCAIALTGFNTIFYKIMDDMNDKGLLHLYKISIRKLLQEGIKFVVSEERYNIDDIHQRINDFENRISNIYYETMFPGNTIEASQSIIAMSPNPLYIDISENESNPLL